jgi:Polyketide cyclase / dehydrase and lipid transport
MRRRHIEVIAHSQTTPDFVFGLLRDGSTWPSWSPIESVELEREGDSSPEGPGAIRVNRRGWTTGRDQIVDIAPDQRFAYVSLSGVPVRDYQAEVELQFKADGTDIHWRASFFPKMPGTGWLMERGLRRFLSKCATGLAAHAESTA